MDLVLAMISEDARKIPPLQRSCEGLSALDKGLIEHGVEISITDLENACNVHGENQ